MRTHDGGAGDAAPGIADPGVVRHGALGYGPSSFRRPDARIAQTIAQALGDADTVLNVGAGTGSYENPAHAITAVEPSLAMRARRPARLATAIDAVAEDLPFEDGRFDASMALFSVDQWSDPAAGLREMRRVTRGPVVILTCDPALVREFWLYDFAPDVLDTEARRHPPLAALTGALGGTVTVESVPVPLDCTDDFNEAYYGRPRGSSIRRRGEPARRGVSSTTARARSSTSRCAGPWAAAPGTKPMDTCGAAPRTAAHLSLCGRPCDDDRCRPMRGSASTARWAPWQGRADPSPGGA
ncbi:class I SAM-dependent methyltransferase [Streptomyces sp. SGAir0957]